MTHESGGFYLRDLDTDVSYPAQEAAHAIMNGLPLPEGVIFGDRPTADEEQAKPKTWNGGGWD